MDAERARNRLNGAVGEDEPVDLPSCVLAQLTQDDLPTDVSI